MRDPHSPRHTQNDALRSALHDRGTSLAIARDDLCVARSAADAAADAAREQARCQEMSAEEWRGRYFELAADTHAATASANGTVLEMKTKLTGSAVDLLVRRFSLYRLTLPSRYSS